MKKIFMLFLFVFFSALTNAQETTDIQVIKNSSSEELTNFVEEDINIIETNYIILNESQKKALKSFFYDKYKMLSTDISTEDLEAFTNKMKARLKIVLGDELYMEISKNQNVFNRITGLKYLVQ